MPHNPEKTTRVALNITHELKAELEALAKADRRPLSQLVRVILEDFAISKRKTPEA